MAYNAEIVSDSKSIAEKEVTLQTVLNVYGICAFLGLIISIFTHPITGIQNMQIVNDEKIMMSPNEMKEFLLFIFGAAVFYFFLVNAYFSGRLGRKAVFMILCFLSVLSVFTFLYFLYIPAPH